jgi:hypothetical protein
MAHLDKGGINKPIPLRKKKANTGMSGICYSKAYTEQAKSTQRPNLRYLSFPSCTIQYSIYLQNDAPVPSSKLCHLTTAIGVLVHIPLRVHQESRA